jgi:cytochrome c biogenesis protein CcmG, thiol:disulfide interchange protein DsbE
VAEDSEGEAPKLPSRDKRDEGKQAPSDSGGGDADFPEPPSVSTANDLTNKKGPDLVVQKYLGSEPNTDGKVVMVVFWATWCGPCIGGIPHQNDLHNAFPDDLVIIGLTSEDEGVVNTFRSRRNVPKAEYVTAIDPQRRVTNVVGNRFIPHCIVMSSDGIVRWQGSPRDLTRATMQAIVDANKALGGEAGGGPMRWVVKKDDQSKD